MNVMTAGTELRSRITRSRTSATQGPSAERPAGAPSVTPTGSARRGEGRRGRIGGIVLGSLAAGAVAAVVLAAAPFIPATEDGFTGAVLLGFALGWALLAGLSIRFTDQPQRWAVAPALFMGVGGMIVLRGSTTFVHDVMSWLWPPALVVLVVWMFVQARRALHSRTRQWVLNPLLAVLALAAVSAGYETAQEAVAAHAYPMTGQLVDVGGHNMHLNCTGTGSPTVVLEPGAGEMSSSLGLITPAVAATTRVCVYDRAGRGWSEPAAGRQDGARIATDLHTLLHRAGVPGPYLLAGHSFGGLYVLRYAAQYPEDVAGMVLVDSTAPAATANQGTGSDPYDLMGRVAAAASAASRFGLGRILAQFNYATLPAPFQGEARASMATANQAGSTVAEYVAANTSMDQARSLTDFAGKPLVVLTAGSGSNQKWFAKQDALAELSSNSVHRIVPGATHASLVDNETDAAAVTRAITDAVTSVRTASPLPNS